MFPTLTKRAAITLLTLAALLLLAACTFPKFNFGGAKSANSTTPEAGLATTGTPGSEDAASGPADNVTATSSPDQPTAETTITAQDFNDPNNLPHGLILFASTSTQPIQKGASEASQDANAERYLWAISLDGRRAGRVSPEGTGSALFVSTAPGKKSRVMENGFKLSGEQIEPVQLPDECGPDGDQTCGGFQFSPNGNMLAYFSGLFSCGRKLTLYNLETGKAAATWSNAHWAYFYKNGSLIISLGDCESQYAYLYVPNTGKQAGVEKIGKAFWNPTHTAVVFQVQGKPELQAGLWGFNLETSRVILWPSKETVIEDTPIWLEDGQSFVFQHQPYLYDQSTKSVRLNGPRQVILMNAWTRTQRLLGYDSRSNYHLCGAEEIQTGAAPGSPCAQTNGEWLRIQRLPYVSLRFPVANRDKPEVRCALYGLDCKDNAEVLALNWKTVKQYPWEEARIPQVIPTPDYNQPDLDKDPFYQDPEGQFAFYVGRDGKTLWYVPRDREPTLWVQDAEGFVYLP